MISRMFVVPYDPPVSRALGKSLAALGLRVDRVGPQWRPRNPYALVLAPGADHAAWIERGRLSGVEGICIVLGRARDPNYIGFLLFDDVVVASLPEAIRRSLECLLHSDVPSRDVLDIAVTLVSGMDWHGLTSRFQDLYDSVELERPPREHADWERMESLARLRDDLLLHVTSTRRRMHDALRLFLIELAGGGLGDAVSLLVTSRREVAALPGSRSVKEDLTATMRNAFAKVKELRERGLSLRAAAAEHVFRTGGA